METTKETLRRLSELREKYKSKLIFSINSFVFFTIMTILCSVSSYLPIFLVYIFGTTSIVFIQQMIRSYNYKRFYEISYNANSIIDKMK
jgi:O-antigen/teichoic acid export membrane protein